MSSISLRLIDSGATVEIELVDLSTAHRSEIEYQLMMAGASTSARGLQLDAFGFRRAAPDLAGLLRRSGAVVEWDAGVEILLTTQLGEIQARQAAETAPPLRPEEVEASLRVTGRFVRSLTERQQENVGQLLAIAHGANFSVPGAGKTTTLLATYEALRGRGSVNRLLVVAPKNAFVSWEDEAIECYVDTETPVVRRATGGSRGVASALDEDPEIVLITYQLLPNVIDLIKSWARRHQTHVVLDESHRAKAGYSGVYSASALQLAEVSTRRDILSGTPLPHQPEDLRPQLDFLWPGQRILPDFRRVSDAAPDVLDEVERRVRPLYVRTTKDQLGLPALNVQPVPVPLGPLQRELYELLRSEAARAAAGMSTRDRRFFRSLGRHVVRLIQAATNPMLLTQGLLVDDRGAPAGAREDRAWELLREVARDRNPAKVARAIELTDAAVADGERVLVWSGFVMNLRVLEERLAHHNPVVIYGQVPTGNADDDETREGRIRRFHEDPTCRVMIANPAAAGEGISLHRTCQYAIYLDRTFNAAHFMQSVDRIHRLGSDRPSRVDVLQATGTIDIRIQQRLVSKILAMSQILNDPGLRALAYDPEDVDEEFEGGIDLNDLEEIIDHLSGPEEGD
jgi:SNF2 family DNA or RNA helicase